MPSFLSTPNKTNGALSLPLMESKIVDGKQIARAMVGRRVRSPTGCMIKQICRP